MIYVTNKFNLSELILILSIILFNWLKSAKNIVFLVKDINFVYFFGFFRFMYINMIVHDQM